METFATPEPQDVTDNAKTGLCSYLFRKRFFKQTISVETTIEVELNAQDLQTYITEMALIPPDWKYYSVEVTGNGISRGAKLTIKHTENAKVP